MKFPKDGATNVLVMVAGLHYCSVNAGSVHSITFRKVVVSSLIYAFGRKPVYIRPSS
jgi:hypothetical protein